MLQSEHFKNYHSNGNHGKPYNSEEDCNNVDDLELEWFQSLILIKFV